MYRISLLLGISLFLASCSEEPLKESTITEIGVSSAENIGLEEGKGSVLIVFGELFEETLIVDEGIDVIVSAKDLEPDANYEITVHGDQNQGIVVFGPEGNLDLKLGTKAGATTIQSTESGELFVSMPLPLRMFTGEEEVTVVISEKDGEEVFRSNPFRFSTTK